MTDLYPRMMFKAGGDEDCGGLRCETRIVNDEIEQGDAVDEGFKFSAVEAHGGEAVAPAPVSTEEASEEIAAMRDEIEGLTAELADERASQQRLVDAVAAKDAEIERLNKELAESGELLKAAEGERDAALKAGETKKSGGAGGGEGAKK